MTKLASGPGPHKPNDDDRARVVLAGLLAAGGFFSAIAPVLVLSKTWSLDDRTVRHVVTMGGAVLVVALLLAAFYVAPGRRREPPGRQQITTSCQCGGRQPARARRRQRDRETGPATRSRTRRRS
jgi:hypothetical protein